MAIDTEKTCWLENTSAGTGDGLAPTHDNFTVSFWLRMNENPVTLKLGAFAWPDEEGWYFYGHFFKNKVSLVHTVVNESDVTETIQSDEGGFASSLVGEWRHQVLRVYYNAGTTEWEMRLYINGAENGIMRHWNQDERVVYPSTKTLWAGRQLHGGLYRYFDCNIESFAFWERALSEAEIEFLAKSRLMDAPLIVDSNQLKYFCRFDEIAAGQAMDEKDYYPHGVEGRHPFEYGGGSGGIGEGSYLSRCVGHDLVAYGPAPRIVEMDAAALAGAAPNTTIVPGPVTVALASAVLSGSAGTISIQPGEIFVILSAAALAAAPGDITVIPGDVTVLMDAAALAASTGAASILPGAVTVGVESASLEAAAAAITIRGGLIILPDGRGIKVAIEDRMILVSMEDRLVGVPTEEKIVATSSEDRTSTVSEEDRTVRAKE